MFDGLSEYRLVFPSPLGFTGTDCMCGQEQNLGTKYYCIMKDAGSACACPKESGRDKHSRMCEKERRSG